MPVRTHRALGSCVLQVLLYDSVDAYIADCQLAPNEVMAHLCTAIDYKDNDKARTFFPSTRPPKPRARCTAG